MQDYDIFNNKDISGYTQYTLLRHRRKPITTNIREPRTAFIHELAKHFLMSPSVSHSWITEIDVPL